MTRKKRERLTPKNIFNKPHYKSIIRLLIEYQDKEFQKKTGLKPVQFRYTLEKNYQNPKFCPICKKKYTSVKSKHCPKCDSKLEIDSRIKSTIKKLEPWFGEKLIELSDTKAIISECITSKQNLKKFLDNLERPPLKALYKTGQKPDIRYHLKKEFYNEGIRLENKDGIDACPQKDIRYVPIKNKRIDGSESRVGGHVIYGLSDEIYNNMFDDKDREFVQNGLKRINRFLDKLYDLKMSKYLEEEKRRLQRLLNSTNSNEIKRFIKKDGVFLSGEIYNGVVINQDMEDTIDITQSKKYFFLKFGIPFKMQPGKTLPPVYIHKELLEALHKYFFNKKKINRESFDKYVQIWSNCLTRDCKDTYNFTLSEIEEMLQWGWDNLDFFIKWRYLGIMYSRYDLYEKNGITQMLKKTY